MALRPSTGLSAQVHDHVKQLLLDGSLPLDAAIPVEAIAGDLGVSRQPVMDAVRRLSQEGFVNVIPQVGSFPRRYRVQEILDFFKLFAESEALVIELACERAEPMELGRLRSLSAEIGRLSELGLEAEQMVRQYRLLNRRFHSEMRVMTKSSAVSDAVENMGDQSDFFVAVAKAPIFLKRMTAAHEEHEEMIAAIAAKDAGKGRAIMKAHVLAIAERIAKQEGSR